MDKSSRGILIAILAVVSLNLVVSSLRVGLELRPGSAASSGGGENEALPSRYSSSLLQSLADRIIVPYNSGDSDALYALLDDFARDQIPRDKFLQQFQQLKGLMGKIESASYTGFQKQQSEGSLATYRLNYVVKLSGSSLPSGTMTITVIDRDTGPGIIGFFVNERTAP